MLGTRFARRGARSTRFALLALVLPFLFASSLRAAPPDSLTFADVPYPMATTTTAVSAYTVAYHDSGLGEGDVPPVLLLHGLGSNLSFWRANIDTLVASGRRVIALDLPGFGKSSKQGVPGTMGDYAATVGGLLDTLGLGAVDLVGHSMGGQIAMTLALAHPERVRRLVLAAPAGIEEFTAEQGLMLKGFMTPERICAADSAQIALQTAMNFATWDARHAWIVEERSAVKAAPDFVDYCAANAASIAGMLDGPVADDLHALTAPTLVVFGADDGLIPNQLMRPNGTPAAIAEAATQLLPNAEAVLIPDAGHLVMLEQPAAFNARVLAFLQDS
ncbi:MAG: alpha/beta fold hydrolase [Bacteroidota bacterium]